MEDIEGASNYLRNPAPKGYLAGASATEWEPNSQNQEEAKTRRPTVSKKKTSTTDSVSGRL